MAQKIFFVRFVRQGGKLDITKIQELVAPFLGVSPKEISEATLISRSEIQGSVKIHRLRSELRKHGFDSDDWDNVFCIGDLIGKPTSHERPTSNLIIEESGPFIHEEPEGNLSNIGIDVESIDSIPDAEDYFSEQFFVDNFSKKEIAYCSRQDNPKQCFAGRFAIKEAVYKATSGLCGKDFSKVEVVKNDNGSLSNNLCTVSVSYFSESQPKFCVAIAMRNEKSTTISDISLQSKEAHVSNNKKVIRTYFFIFLVSVIYFIDLLYRYVF